MRRDIHGIHHTGILTRDLDALERTYTALGFTLSPRSRHLLAAAPGAAPTPGCTANRCALFGDGYIELLGIVDESAPDPWHTKAMADEYEGFRLLNLETHDAAATHRRLTASGLCTSGVLALERDVDTEDGLRTMRARAVHLAPDATPEGYVGIAQHLTRRYVHQPRYLEHPNTACGLDGVLIVAEDTKFDAITRRYSFLLETVPELDGPLAVLSTDHVQLRIVRSSHADDVLPDEPTPAASYLAAMSIAVRDLITARDVVERAGIDTRPTSDGFFVSAHDTHAGLFFTTR
ncbi:VOC family protein [Yinghuangia sp. YIM S09857]|uniref:VOC family protein n=1 Tax=Yinghuangia sp. YIM S09857 TaxID=3436929 RepID=UPI003F538930